jgi:broad specificity phosphatase PhoE
MIWGSSLVSAAASASLSKMTRRTSRKSTSNSKTVILTIVRHGQAQHNPRAEYAKANGCSHDEFIRLMREDDALDADLTELGRDQARQCNAQFFYQRYSSPFKYIVSSPLSRALETADLIYPPSAQLSSCRRVCLEDFREINGNLLNGQRRTKSELRTKFPHWDFDLIRSHHDDTWTEEMEPTNDAAERGYRGLCWLLGLACNDHDVVVAAADIFNDQQTSEVNVVDTTDGDSLHVLLVSHGGLLRYTMNDHPLVHLSDEREDAKQDLDGYKSVGSRFDNCEVRRYRLSWKSDDDSNEKNMDGEKNRDVQRNPILLTQIDF